MRKQRKLQDVGHQRHLVVQVVGAVVHQDRADRERKNRALQRKFRIRISTFEFWKNEIFFRMADPANKTFEDFERSTQGGGQSECPLGYGNEPKAQQVNRSISADDLKT